MTDKNHSEDISSKTARDLGGRIDFRSRDRNQKRSEQVSNIRMPRVGIISTAVIAGVLGYLCGALLPVADVDEVKNAETALESQLKKHSSQLQKESAEISNLISQLAQSSEQLHQANAEISSLKAHLDLVYKKLPPANVKTLRGGNTQTIQDEGADRQNSNLQSFSSLRPESRSTFDISRIPKYKIDQDVRLGDVRWKVLEAKDRGEILHSADSKHSGLTDSITTTGKFIQIWAEVENLGTNMKTAASLYLVDSKGREYTPASNVNAWIPENQEILLINNLNPNVPVTFSVLYVVPEDAADLMVRVDDLSHLGQWGQEEALITVYP